MPEAIASDHAPAVPKPPQLSEKEATTLGCELLGEAFVWGVGLALLLHQAAKDDAHDAAQQAELLRLAEASQKQAVRIEELEAKVAAAPERPPRTQWARRFGG